MNTERKSDYQDHVEAKKDAIPLGVLEGKRVLDVGCDHGAWSFLAKDCGAKYVLGLDRGREVKERGFIDLVNENSEHAINHGIENVEFKNIDLGKQWHEFGSFDVIFCFSVYHHIYENCGDHLSIWFWLWRHLAENGVVLWENPVDDRDQVVKMNVSDENRKGYNREAIFKAAAEYFDFEYVGPAKHEPFREVWRFTKRKDLENPIPSYGAITFMDGAGGATKAFEYAGGRRMSEIEKILGVRPIAGSLNVMTENVPNWDKYYYRSQILDLDDRSKGLESEWHPRWCRFYPLNMGEKRVWAMRFEGEHYRLNFVELISDQRLRAI